MSPLRRSTPDSDGHPCLPGQRVKGRTLSQILNESATTTEASRSHPQCRTAICRTLIFLGTNRILSSCVLGLATPSGPDVRACLDGARERIKLGAGRKVANGCDLPNAARGSNARRREDAASTANGGKSLKWRTEFRKDHFPRSLGSDPGRAFWWHSLLNVVAERLGGNLTERVGSFAR